MHKSIRTLGKRDKTVHVNLILQSQLFIMTGDRRQGVFYNSLNTRRTTAMAVLLSVGLGKERDLQSPVWEAPGLASTPYPLPLLGEGSPHTLQTFISFVCMGVLTAHMLVHHMLAGCPQRLEEGAIFLGSGEQRVVINHVGAGNQTNVLRKTSQCS